jgi:hypothetical protein
MALLTGASKTAHKPQFERMKKAGRAIPFPLPFINYLRYYA